MSPTDEKRQRISTRIVVSGRVQGVGFRAFTVSAARHLGVTGWVRNQPDGRSVEIVAEGDADSLERFLDRVSDGPPGANVTHVHQSRPTNSESFGEFTVRY